MVDVALPQAPVVLPIELENRDWVVAEPTAAAAVSRRNLVGQSRGDDKSAIILRSYWLLWIEITVISIMVTFICAI